MGNRAGKEAATAMKIFRTIGKICTVIEMRYVKEERGDRQARVSESLTKQTAPGGSLSINSLDNFCTFF